MLHSNVTFHYSVYQIPMLISCIGQWHGLNQIKTISKKLLVDIKNVILDNNYILVFNQGEKIVLHPGLGQFHSSLIDTKRALTDEGLVWHIKVNWIKNKSTIKYTYVAITKYVNSLICVYFFRKNDTRPTPNCIIIN